VNDSKGSSVSEVTSLGELARQGRVVLNDGYRTRADELGVPGVPILRVAEVHDGFITPSFGDHVHENFRSKFAAKMSAAGDIVVTTKGTVGRVALMREDHPEFVSSPQVCFFRCSAGSDIAPEWLYFWFKGPEFTIQALGVQSQTDMAPYINLADMRSISITVPPMREQRAIAGVLGALDDKIESNRRLVSTCESLSQVLLEASRVESCEVVGLGDLARFRNSERKPLSALQRAEMSGDRVYPYFGATGVFDYVDDYLFDDLTVLVGEDGSVVNEDGSPVVQLAWGKYWVNNHAHVLVGEGVSTELLYVALRRSDVRPLVTGAVQAKVSMGNLRTLGLELPQTHARPALEAELQLIMERMRKAFDETAVLERTREALLPELLSGRLRVREAVAVVEGAL